MPEHDFFAFVVQPRIEPERGPTLPWVLDRPSCKRASDFGDVLLRVSAVDTERVQLHELAAVVLVEASARVRARWPVGRRLDTWKWRQRRETAAAAESRGRDAGPRIRIRMRETLGDFARRERKGRQRLQASVERGVVDAIWTELFLDVLA